MSLRVLVTGGSGFIGSHLVDRLLGLGHYVTVYDKAAGPHVASPDFYDAYFPRYHFIQGEMLAAERLAEALDGKKIVFHFAAHADLRSGIERPSIDLEQNLLATSLLLEHMRRAGVGQIVFASTSAVYGEPTVFPTPENAPFPIQTSLYGASKAAAEGLISAYCHGFGMQATIFRFAPVLGERYRHGHVWDFVNKLRTDPNRIEVLGNGRQRKSYVYVGDVMDGIETVLSVQTGTPVQVFNVSGDASVTVNQSLDWICDELGVNPSREYTGGERGWAGDPPYILLDSSKLRTLGWIPKVSVEEAIRRTVRSFSAVDATE